jgi:hypothetical protein
MTVTTHDICAIAGGKLLLTAAEASVLLNYRTTNAFREQLKRGKLNALVVNRRGNDIYITAESIANYLNALEADCQSFLDGALTPISDKDHIGLMLEAQSIRRELDNATQPGDDAAYRNRLKRSMARRNKVDMTTINSMTDLVQADLRRTAVRDKRKTA